MAEKYIDLDGLIELAGTAEFFEMAKHFETEDAFGEFSPVGNVRLAVAMDEAFCFYYEDNLEMLRRLGAEIVPFSPLHDASLPEHIHGVYIGGGYPELYAEKLSKNESMRADILRLAAGAFQSLESAADICIYVSVFSPGLWWDLSRENAG